MSLNLLALFIGIYGTNTNILCLGGGTTDSLACWNVTTRNWEIAHLTLPAILNDMIAVNYFNGHGTGLERLTGGWDASGTSATMFFFASDSSWASIYFTPSLNKLSRSASTILYVGGTQALVVGGRELDSQLTYVNSSQNRLFNISITGGFQGYGVSITYHGMACAVGATTICFDPALKYFVKGPPLITPRQYAGKIVISGKECVVGGVKPDSTSFVNSIECPVDTTPSPATNGLPWQFTAIGLDYGFVPDTPGTISFSLDGLSCVSLLYQQTTRVLCIDGNNSTAGWQQYPSPPLYLQGGLAFNFPSCNLSLPQVPPWCSCNLSWDCFADCTCQPRPPETDVVQSTAKLSDCLKQLDFYNQTITCVSNIPPCLAVGPYLSVCSTCGCTNHFFLNCTCKNNTVQTQPYDVRLCISGVLNYSLTNNTLVCDESANYALQPKSFERTICVAGTVNISRYLLFQRDSMSEQLCAVEAASKKMRWFAVNPQSCYAWAEYDPLALSAMTAVSCNGDPSTMYAISETVTFLGCPNIPQGIQDNCTCTNPVSCDLNCTCHGTSTYLATTSCSGGYTLNGSSQVICLPPSPNISTYLGCYSHDVNWALPSLTRLVLTSATVDGCMQAAIRLNFTVFGMENGYECFGMSVSDAFVFAGNQTLTSIRNCDSGCNGGQTYFSSGCGAYNLMSLYTVAVKSLISPTASSVGCYRDHYPHISGGRWYLDNQMGVAECAMQAKIAGKSVFGIEAGHECHLFDSLEVATQLGISDNCNEHCGHGTPEFVATSYCGGDWALSVFTLDDACPMTRFWYSNFKLTDMTTQLPACPYVLYPGQTCQPGCAAGFDNAMPIPPITCGKGGNTTIKEPTGWLAFEYPPLCLPGKQFGANFSIEGWRSNNYKGLLDDNNYPYYWNDSVQKGSQRCNSTGNPSGWFWWNDCTAHNTTPRIEDAVSESRIAWRIQSQVVVSTSAIYRFQWGVDCDYGAGMEVDGVLQRSKWSMLWWEGSFVKYLNWDSDTYAPYPGNLTARNVFAPGMHVFTGYCFEGASDAPTMGSITIEGWKPETVQWEVVGCFQNRPSDPILQTPILNSYTMYPALCAAEAAALGYPYFAITNASQCWGGSNNISLLVPSTCEKTCTDSTQCGGVNSWTLFSTRIGIVDYPTSIAVFQRGIFQLRNNNYSSDSSPPLWAFSNGMEFSGTTIIINPYTFQPAKYTFTVSAAGMSSQPYPFQVVSTPLVVIVLGGNKSVTGNSVVTLDASNSYDPDIGTGSLSSLKFAWHIIGSSTQQLYQTSSVLSFPVVSGANSPTTITIMVNVSSLATLSKWSVGYSQLEVTPTPVISNITLTGPSAVSPSDMIRLLATVTNLVQLATFTWTVTPSLVTLDCSSQIGSPSPLSQTRALTLPGYCLNPGMVYRFTFQVDSAPQGGSAQGWIDVTALNPPTGGTCNVSSASGVPLETIFSVECSEWNSQSTSVLGYALKQITPDGHLTALSVLQYSSTFNGVILDGEPGSSVELVVVMSSLTSSTMFTLPTISLIASPSSTCPLLNFDISSYSNDETAIPPLIAAVRSISVSSSSVSNCNDDDKAAVWNSLWTKVNMSVSTFSFIEADSVELYVTAIDSLIQVAPLLPSLTNSTALVFQDNVVGLMNKLLADGEVTTNTTKALVSTLPEPTNCNTLESTLSLVSSRVSQVVGPQIPGEPPVQMQGNLLAVTAQKFFSNDNNNIGDTQTSLNLPIALLEQAGEVSTVFVTDYTNVLTTCRQKQDQGASAVVSTSIVNITLATSQLDRVLVNNVIGGFSFTTPFNPDAASCGKPVCAWWKSSTSDGNNNNDTNSGGTGEWSREGCQTQSATSDTTTCVCTHLTEFSLILRPGCVSFGYRVAYYVFLACYGIAFIVIAGKIALRIWAVHWKHYTHGDGDGSVQMGIVLWQHFMLAILTVARIISCTLLAQNRQDWSIASRAVIFLLPYMIQYWVFTLLAFQWASIYHFGMTSVNPFKRVRKLFLFSNLAIVASLIATIVAISLSSTTADQTVTASASLVAAVTLLTALGFVIYAVALYRGIRIGSDSSNHPGTATSRKLMGGAVMLFVLLCLEAIMHLSATIHHQNKEAIVGGDASEVVVLVADILCITTVLGLYHHSMNSTKNSRSQGTEMRSKSN